MQLTKTLFSLAFPAIAMATFATEAIANINAEAELTLKQLESVGCDYAQCIAAVAPMLVNCDSALKQKGYNPVVDVACLVAISSNLANPPTACSGCV